MRVKIADHAKHDLIHTFFQSILAIFFALFVAGIIILLGGGNPLKAFQAIIAGSFGGIDSFILTIQKTIPLIFTGLSVGVAFKAGLFNIGAEGQLYIGAIIAAWAGNFFPDFPRLIKMPLIFLLAIIGGALWGYLPGLLKARKKTHEVLTTIMMNYIAIHLTLFLVKGPLRSDPYNLRTDILPESSRLPVMVQSGALFFSYGIILAIIVAIGVWFLLKHTTSGFKIRAVGEEIEAAKHAGFNVGSIIILSMMLAGGIGALAGAVEVTGLHYTFYGQFSPGYGFDGIAVALLANNNPIGILFSALLFGALRASARTLNLIAGVPHHLTIIIQGLVILFVGIRYFLSKRFFVKFTNSDNQDGKI